MDKNKEGLLNLEGPIFFETASFHIIKPCNMGCKFCYATFEDIKKTRYLPTKDAITVLKKLKDYGLKKITFAGGEPLLYPGILDVIEYSKSIGLVTSIITNGSLLTEDLLGKFVGILDWIGISIDSISEDTNEKSGRVIKSLHKTVDYDRLLSSIKSYGFKLKINTVVHAFNQEENMQDFINKHNPLRWKIFDTLKVDGQNDSQYESIRTKDSGFDRFVERHKHPSMVVESNEAMTGSYLLIDPKGRLFENSSGFHTYSDPLHENSIEHCLSQIRLDKQMFIKRGGIYEY